MPLLALTACAEARAGAESVLVRDSAGIEIVESVAPAWAADEEWRLSPEPIPHIGEIDGANEYQFDRPISAFRRADGGVVVADAGHHGIRFYDSSGTFVRTTGRKGAGPGEFEQLGVLQLLSRDSLFAFDHRLRRVSLFAPDGAFVRSVSLTSSMDTGFPRVLGRLGDGSLLVSIGRVLSAGEVKDGFSRDSVAYLRYSADGQPLDTIAVLPGSENWVKTQDKDFTVSSLLYGRTAVNALGGDRVVLGSNDAWELGFYSADGGRRRLIRRSQPPRPVTDDDWDETVRKRLKEMEPQWRERLELMHREMPRASTMPFYSSAMLDDAGNLWVQEFRSPRDERSVWTVFDLKGWMVGGVRMPDDFRPTHSSDDFVLGIWRDEIDVQYVRMFALQKPR